MTPPRFIDRVVGAVADEARIDASGATVFDHLLVVAPTAQSLRRLRAALARRYERGCVPPRDCVAGALPALFDGRDAAPAVAGRCDEIAAFWEARGGSDANLDAAVELCDLGETLCENALSFADVAGRIGQLLQGDLADVEAKRWRQLAEIEAKCRAILSKRGLIDRISSVQGALAAVRAPAGIEKVIVVGPGGELPLVWRVLERAGLPVVKIGAEESGDSAEFPRECIHPQSDASSEAGRIAEVFAGVPAAFAPPSLCLADASMFPEIRAALRAAGVEIHHPASSPVAGSPLGRIVGQIAELFRSGDYSVFSTFVRTGDARRWFAAELRMDDSEIAEALADLDRRQAERLPEKIADIVPVARGKLRAMVELVQTRLRKGDVRGMLAAVFAPLKLDAASPDAREFAAAAKAIAAVLDEIEGCNLPDALKAELFALRAGEAVYSTEPDSGDAVVIDGWLELPFAEADEIVIAGFAEGAVPQAIVGHPFLPDALRSALGLADNEARARRDRRLLALAREGRKNGAVHIFFHSTDSEGNALKPSRLLFETADDGELAARVRAFYGNRAGTGATHAWSLPGRWRLQLPVPPERRRIEKLSPTRLDGYLRCPFTAYLRDRQVLGDKRMDDRAEELASWEYGNLAHAALEAWGGSELRDSDDARAIADYLAEDVDRQLRERFGDEPPAIVALQGESVKCRLANFARIQSERRRAGWRIVAAEKKLEVVYGHTRFNGKCDRIDYNEATGRWCVIDYKTWDCADGHESRDARTGEWKSLQLAFYCAMLDVLGEPPFDRARREVIEACYAVLGRTAADTCFTAPIGGGLLPEAETAIRAAVERMERGIFWPPSKKDEWRYDFSDWLDPDPGQTVDEEWLADQRRRIDELAAEQAADGEDEV